MSSPIHFQSVAMYRVFQEESLVLQVLAFKFKFYLQLLYPFMNPKDLLFGVYGMHQYQYQISQNVHYRHSNIFIIISRHSCRSITVYHEFMISITEKVAETPTMS